MAKRNSGARRSNSGKTTRVAGAAAPETIEQRVVAFAEQLGRIAGTMQAKAEDWTNRDMLSAQVASVRDAAADLLEQIAGPVKRVAAKSPAKKAATTATRKGGPKRPVPAATSGAGKGRSGGVVDAPGKKHRKPMPSDPNKTVAASQAAKMRTAMPMAKTDRFRGRG